MLKPFLISKTLILILLVAGGLSTQVCQSQQIHVRSLNDDFDAKAMAGEQAIVDKRPADRDVLTPLDPSVRDSIIKKVQLGSLLKKFDESDKDLFFIRAKSSTYLELKKRYPKLSSAQYKNLKILLEREK